MRPRAVRTSGTRSQWPSTAPPRRARMSSSPIHGAHPDAQLEHRPRSTVLGTFASAQAASVNHSESDAELLATAEALSQRVPRTVEPEPALDIPPPAEFI